MGKSETAGLLNNEAIHIANINVQRMAMAGFP